MTLIVKALAAAIAGFTFYKIKKMHSPSLVKCILSGLPAAIVVILGYFVFEIFYEGFAPAVAEILPNIIQTVSGIAISTVLYPILSAVPTLKQAIVK